MSPPDFTDTTEGGDDEENKPTPGEQLGGTDSPKPEPTPADVLSAIGRTDGITFMRVAGGEGPGWLGNTYCGLPIQTGRVGTFTGNSLDVILQQVQDKVGGGTYEWFATRSNGKPIRGTIKLAGQPLPLPVDDPAAAYQRAVASGQAVPGYGASPTAAGAPMPLPGPPLPQNANPLDPRYLNNQYVWSQTLGGWVWNSYDGTPDPGRPPRNAPGYAPGMSPMGSLLQPAEDPEKKKILEKLEKLESKMEGKGTESLATVMAAMMTSQSQMVMAVISGANNNRGGMEAREAAMRQAESDMRKQMFDQQMAFQKELLNSHKRETPKSAADQLSEHLDLQKKLKDAGYAGDSSSVEERIGEKVIDALGNFAELGKKWIDKKDDGGGKKEEKKKAPEKNGNGNGSSGSISKQEEGNYWLKILETVAECYDAQFPAHVTAQHVISCCKGADVDPDSVILALRLTTPEKLLELLAKQDEPAKSRADAIASRFQTGDGSQWFSRLLTYMRGLKTDAENAKK